MLPALTDQSLQIRLRNEAYEKEKQHNPLLFLVPPEVKPKDIAALSKRRFTIKPKPPIKLNQIAKINLFKLQDYTNELAKKWFPIRAFGFENLQRSRINLGQLNRHIPFEDEALFWKKVPYYLLQMSKQLNSEFEKELGSLPLKTRLSSLFLQYLAFTLNLRDEQGVFLAGQERHLVFSNSTGFEWKPYLETKEHLNSHAYRFYVLALCNFLEDDVAEFVHSFSIADSTKKEDFVIISPITQIMDKLLTNSRFSLLIFNDLKLRQVVCRFYLNAILKRPSDHANDLSDFAKLQKKNCETIMSFIKTHQQKIVNASLQKKEADESLKNFLIRKSLTEKKKLIAELKIDSSASMLSEEYLLTELLFMVFSRPRSIICSDDRQMTSYRDYLERMRNLDCLFPNRILSFRRTGGFNMQKGQWEYINFFFKKEVTTVCYFVDTFRAMMTNLVTMACAFIPEHVVSKTELQKQLDIFKLGLKKESFDWKAINLFFNTLANYIELSTEANTPS